MGDYLNKCCFSPFAQTLITCGLIFLGLVGSFYAEPLKAPINDPVSFFTIGGFTANKLLTVAFWASLLLLFYGFYKGQAGQRQKEQTAQKEALDHQERNINKLQKLINTMPPDDFLRRYPSIYKKSFDVVMSVLKSDKPEKEFVEVAIQNILKSIISLARAYDVNLPVGGVTYGANVMIFEKCTSADEKITFFPDWVNSTKIKGTLRLYNELSATSAKEDVVPDEEVQKITLPVFSDDPVQAKENEMPGAPLAFVANSPTKYSDTGTLQQWLETNSLFDKKVRDAVGHYFSNEGGAVKSFFSVPVPGPLGDEKIVRTPVAILNLHRNTTGLFDDDSLFQQFLWVISPFIEYLDLLLSVWNESKNQKS